MTYLTILVSFANRKLSWKGLDKGKGYNGCMVGQWIFLDFCSRVCSSYLYLRDFPSFVYLFPKIFPILSRNGIKKAHAYIEGTS